MSKKAKLLLCIFCICLSVSTSIVCTLFIFKKVYGNRIIEIKDSVEIIENQLFKDR